MHAGVSGVTFGFELLVCYWCAWAHVQDSCHNHRDRKLLLSFKWKMRFSHGHFISRREAFMKTPVRASFMINTGKAIGLFKIHEPQKKPGKICLVSDFIEACSSAPVCPKVHWSSAFQVILIRFMGFFPKPYKTWGITWIWHEPGGTQ